MRGKHSVIFLFWQDKMKELDQKYLLYLKDKGLMPKTIDVYNRLYGYWCSLPEMPVQEKALSFMRNHNYPLAHAFLKSYLVDFLKVEGLTIPKGIDKNKVKKAKVTLEKEKVLGCAEHWGSKNYKRDWLILKIFWQTAARCDELVNIHLDDIDYLRGEILIRKGKGGKQRKVALNKVLAAEITHYISTTPKKKFWNDLLFPLTTRRIHQIITGMSRGELHPHAIRRSAATHLLSQGVNVVEVQSYLGHSSIRTTQEYVKVMDEEKMREKIKKVV